MSSSASQVDIIASFITNVSRSVLLKRQSPHCARDKGGRYDNERVCRVRARACVTVWVSIYLGKVCYHFHVQTGELRVEQSCVSTEVHWGWLVDIIHQFLSIVYCYAISCQRFKKSCPLLVFYLFKKSIKTKIKCRYVHWQRVVSCFHGDCACMVSISRTRIDLQVCH